MECVPINEETVCILPRCGPPGQCAMAGILWVGASVLNCIIGLKYRGDFGICKFIFDCRLGDCRLGDCRLQVGRLGDNYLYPAQSSLSKLL